MVAGAAARLEFVNQERNIASKVVGMSLTPYLGALQPQGVVFTPSHIVEGVAQDDNAQTCRVGSDYTNVPMTRTVDQVVVNDSVVPLDDLYFALKPKSRNKGLIDYDALLAGEPQLAEGDASTTFDLYRIGDAVSSRNVHAAIYVAPQFVKDIYDRRAAALALEAGRIERRKIDRGGTSGDEVRYQSSRHATQCQS